MERRGIKPETLENLSEFFELCDNVRYAPAEVSRQEMQNLFELTENTIKQLSETGWMMRRLSPIYLLAPVFLALMICGRSLAQETIQPNTIFFEANRFYKSEQYPQAIEAYEELAAAGILSGHLFYNLGNAYIKTGSIGKAILNYERALQRLPRDADVKSNLEYARSLVEGETITERRNWFSVSGFLSRPLFEP